VEEPMKEIGKLGEIAGNDRMKCLEIQTNDEF
jgi:hypothetical protein